MSVQHPSPLSKLWRTGRGALVATACLAGLLGSASAAEAQTSLCSTTAQVWKCWEGSLTAVQSYTNAYRDVKLKVTFTKLGQANLTTYAFWDGGSTFKFRTAFPASGTWSWSTNCEAGCAADTGLHNRTGSVSVATHADTNPLYSHGFLQVNKTFSTNLDRYLMHADTTPFFWLGDTTWAGPLRAVASPDEWATYLTNRQARKFSVVQTALPVDWMRSCGFHPDDAAGQKPFIQISGCSSADAVPNSCSRWNPAFWQEFDKKIQRANNSGFEVMLVGLRERLIEGCNQGQPYPTMADTRIYARNVAARLSGNHVIFSPTFDRKPDVDPATCTASSTSQSCRMRFIGEEIKAAAPRHLVTNHWAGSLAVTEMQPFQSQTWLDFQMFQSGQAKSESNGNVNTQLTLITQRARELPYTLWTYTPTKPSVNGEAIYDGVNDAQLGTANYNAYRVRQTAYLSLLSGAVGYSYGVQGVTDWGTFASNYTTGMARTSNLQMEYLGNLFRSVAWERLIPEHGRIKNQATDEHKKMVVARDANATFLLAYLPDNPDIKIRFASINTIPKTGRWYNPRLGTYAGSVTGVVDPLDSLAYTFTRPACPVGDTACATEPDWVLVLP